MPLPPLQFHLHVVNTYNLLDDAYIQSFGFQYRPLFDMQLQKGLDAARQAAGHSNGVGVEPKIPQRIVHRDASGIFAFLQLYRVDLPRHRTAAVKARAKPGPLFLDHRHHFDRITGFGAAFMQDPCRLKRRRHSGRPVKIAAALDGVKVRADHYDRSVHQLALPSADEVACGIFVYA